MVERSNRDRRRITEKILAVADRLQRVDRQQLSQLARVLEEVDPEDVFEGLYVVFASGGDDYWQRLIELEYAGHVLLHCRPPCLRPLSNAVRGVVDRWNLSVEQLPIYLQYTFGPAELDRCLSDLEQHSTSRALEVLRWWTRSGRNQDPEDWHEFLRFVEGHPWVDTSIR
jgi:hypothetical protein